MFSSLSSFLGASLNVALGSVQTPSNNQSVLFVNVHAGHIAPGEFSDLAALGMVELKSLQPISVRWLHLNWLLEMTYEPYASPPMVLECHVG